MQAPNPGDEVVTIPPALQPVETITSGNLVLMPVSAADAPRVYDAAQDENFARWLPWARGEYTAVDALEFTTTYSREQWESGSPLWGIHILGPDGTLGPLVGAIDLKIRPHEAEVGFWMHRDSAGQGLMTQACALVAQAAFEKLGVQRLLHIAEVGNVRSRRVGRNVGFIPEGVRRVEGANGTVEYQWQSALAKSDWSAMAANKGTEMTNFPPVPPARVLPGDRPSDLVSEFHTVYDMPNRVEDGLPATLDFERLPMRMALIQEEVTELIQAVYGPSAGRQVAEVFANLVDEGERDVVEAADALADLTYVVYGMALEAGIDLDQVLAEVHSSNLSKLMPDGSVKRREDGKILKGPNFQEPDIAPLLGVADQ